jgi:hypothetical protein
MAKKKHAVRKKYVSPVEQQRLQEAHYKNLFFAKLRTLCAQIGDVSLFRQIPSAELPVIYAFRGAPLKVVAAPGTKIHKRLLEALVRTIKSRQLTMRLDVVENSEQKMSFADYWLVGMPFERSICESAVEYPAALFAKYADMAQERVCDYERGIVHICRVACWVFDDLDREYLHTYAFDFDLPVASSGVVPPPPGTSPYSPEGRAYMAQDFRTHQRITIGTLPLEVRRIEIDGETHIAIQTGSVYYVDNKPLLEPFTVPLEDLRVDSPFAKLDLPVYIQRHALERMRERLGGEVPPAFYRIILAQALIRKEFIPISKTRFLMACFTEDLKVGYFVAEMVDGILLIRTFLLLTNSGTPEGDRLAQLTGLQADDRKYLAIDTLQGLANSDIEQNESFCSLLRAAGCGSILKLCRKINSDPGMMWLLDRSQPKNMISDLITEYLKTSAGEEVES